MEEFVVRQRIPSEMNSRGARTQGFDPYQHIGSTVAPLLGYRLYKSIFTALFLSFRRVLNVIYSFLGNSPASEF